MVVIEHQQTEDEEQTSNPPKAVTAKSSTADAGKDVSDGFETASDAELGSDGDDNDGEDGGVERSRGEEQPRQQEQELDQALCDSSNDASNSEELAQVLFCY